jgi:hypothetical protein
MLLPGVIPDTCYTTAIKPIHTVAELCIGRVAQPLMLFLGQMLEIRSRMTQVSFPSEYYLCADRLAGGTDRGQQGSTTPVLSFQFEQWHTC